ncbi:flagellar export protein FliJ [bacterium]|nr:flagellar export protein FliJ [bacterium]MBU1598827.1 flagellar export protein FliJ [bacterium]
MAFRFEKVLRIKKHREDILKEELANWQRTLEFEDALLEKIKDVLKQALNETAMSQNEVLSINKLKTRHSFILRLEQEKEDQAKRLKELNQELEEARKRAITASAERKVIEKLKEKNTVREKKEEEKVDQFIMDEIGLSLFERKANQR